MSVKLLIQQHLEFLRLKRGCSGPSESTLVKLPHCLKSHVTAHLIRVTFLFFSQAMGAHRTWAFLTVTAVSKSMRWSWWYTATALDWPVIPLFHTGHESPESPRIDFFLIRGDSWGFIIFFAPIVMSYESSPIQIRCRYEYAGESAQFGWNRPRIHYD